MKKQLSLITAALACAFATWASPVTPWQALERASNQERLAVKAKDGLKLVKTVSDYDNVASAYIFKPENGSGFTVMSADDVLPPILGYSDSGVIDVDNLPPAMEWWLLQFASKAAYLERKGRSETIVKSLVGKEAVTPLLKTKWNQDEPYNNDCPLVGGYKAPTGCVATSLAQVMKYFNYPDKGLGKISYNDNGVNRSLQLNKQAFDWDNMLDVYSKGNYNDAQADAVAYLMKAAGYSVEMGYGASASGAQSYKLVNALVKNFKYDVNAYYTERELYSADAWSELIYNNLVECGPVIYDGSSMQGGHSFVCDGYDGNGYFHFNWGWGGMSDGYYLLDNLNPESQGIGGSDGGFNASQGAVIGIRKPKGYRIPDYDKIKILGTVVAHAEGNNVVFQATGSSVSGWMNGSYRDIRCSIGAIFRNVATGDSITSVEGSFASPQGSTVSVVQLSPYAYYDASRINAVVPVPDDLPDGNYKMTLATRTLSDGGNVWVPMLVDWGLANYCMLKVEDGRISVSSGAANIIDVSNSKFESPVYMNRRTKLVTSFVNDTEDQLTMCFTPVLVRDGGIQYMGDYMLASVDAKSSTDVESVVKFYQTDDATAAGYGTYSLNIYNVDTGELIGPFGTYEMEYAPANLKVSLEDLSVVDAKTQDVISGDRTFKNAYIVDNAKNFDVHFAYKVDRGYLDSSVRLIVSEYVPSTSGWNAFEQNLYSENPFAGQGDQEDVTVEADFSGQNYNAVYQIRAAYLDGVSNKSMGSIYVAFNTSGIDDVSMDDVDAEIEYYNLQGIRVDNPVKGMTFIRKVGSQTKVVVY